MKEGFPSEGRILFAPLAEVIIRTCENIRQLIQEGYDYSISNLLSEVERNMRSIKVESEEMRKLIEEHISQTRYAKQLLHCFETNIYLYQEIVKAFRNVKLSQEDLASPVAMVEYYIRSTYQYAIKVFVDAVRRIGSIDASTFDRYGQFKLKWNKNLTDFENDISQYLSKMEDLSKYIAPELGVPVKTT